MLCYVSKNDEHYHDYGPVFWTSPQDEFRSCLSDFSALRWLDCSVGIESMNLRSSTCTTTNLGDYFILYFYTYGSEGLPFCEIRNRLTGQIELAEIPEIMPFDILQNSAGELLFFCENDTMIDIYTLAEEIQVSNDEPEIVKNHYELCNYPNPFNPGTEIAFHLDQASNVRIEVYNIKGQKVDTIADEHFDAGQHDLIWNAEDVLSGVYFYRINTDKDSATGKMILLK
ncbi:MAG: T9SS type A sorting domain-containing protein [Candidatus Cloacimonetes bacterium]|nr:T9SS type A sorting domain-containing protein [Candidatus Cloacimonadota bacterium]